MPTDNRALRKYGVSIEEGKFVDRHLLVWLRGVSEGTERRMTRAAGVKGGTKVEKSTEDIVVEAGNLRRLSCALPVFSRQTVVKIDFLPIVDDS